MEKSVRSTDRRQKILLLVHFEQTAAVRSLKVPDELVASLSDQMRHVEKDKNLACFWLDSIQVRFKKQIHYLVNWKNSLSWGFEMQHGGLKVWYVLAQSSWQLQNNSF